ncbi:hypothetical protein TcCL_Unassigned03462 [Trypanosoma cruzi]|nr:hypothetical protein TcCL_Unassigned03462 [Trypanosoma cruzi]
MDGCRQEALTIKMAREHAATPRRNTRGEGDEGKARSSTNTQKEQTPVSGKAPPRPSHWPATPHQTSHTHTPSQCRQSAGERIRPSTQQTHTPPAATHHGRAEETQRHHRLQFNPTANGIRPQPRSQHTAHTERAITTEPHAEAIPHPSTTRRLTPSGRDTRPARCLSPPFASCPREKAAPTRSCHTHRKRTIRIHCDLHSVCVCLCVPAETRGKEVKKEAEHVKKRKNKMCSRAAW